MTDHQPEFPTPEHEEPVGATARSRSLLLTGLAVLAFTLMMVTLHLTGVVGG